MNKDWTKWVILSLSEHFSKALVGCHIDGNDKPTNQPTDSFEIRYLGPDFELLTKSETKCKLVINCQIITAKSITEPAIHLERIGQAQVAMADCIKVFKFGKNSDTDDGTLFNVLQLKSDIKTTNFGTVDVVSRLLRSTVEVLYEMTIGG